jgi:hypothetical protein
MRLGDDKDYYLGGAITPVAGDAAQEGRLSATEAES